MAFGARIALFLVCASAFFAHPALSATAEQTTTVRKRNVVRGKNTVAVTSKGEPLTEDVDVQALMQDPESMQKMAQSMQQMLAENPDGLKELMQDDESDVSIPVDTDGLESLVSDGHVPSMDELHEGFQQLTSVEKPLIGRLKETLEARSLLEVNLGKMLKRVRSDNKRIKKDLSAIAKGVAVAPPAVPVAEQTSLAEEQGGSALTTEDIKASFTEKSEAMMEMVEVLHKRDADDLAALWKDAGIHQKLSKQLQDSIKVQQEVLSQASNEELGALNEIK